MKQKTALLKAIKIPLDNEHVIRAQKEMQAWTDIAKAERHKDRTITRKGKCTKTMEELQKKRESTDEEEEEVQTTDLTYFLNDRQKRKTTQTMDAHLSNSKRKK